jgi:hypothetical protein
VAGNSFERPNRYSAGYLCWPAADFFTVEVLTWRALVAYYVLYFLNLESRWGCPAVGSVLEVQLRALQPG